MVVIEEVAEARGRDDLRIQGDVGADVIRRVGSSKSQTVREALYCCPKNIFVDQVRRFCGDWVRLGQVGATLAAILIKPRTKDADFGCQSGINPGCAKVLLAILVEYLFSETKIRTKV